MAVLDRAQLKAFFETGDKPTQAQFADLIDTLVSLSDNSNFADGVQLKSATDGKFQLDWDDSFWQLTSDGGNFLESGVFLDPTSFYLQAIGAWIFFDGSAALDVAEIRIPLDRRFQFFYGSLVAMSIIGDVSLLHFNIDTPQFADNAAALLGGLVVDDIYHDPTGIVRTVV